MFLDKSVICGDLCVNYRNRFVTQCITYLNNLYIYIQVSDVLCYKLIPIIYRTSLLQNSLKVIICVLTDSVYNIRKYVKMKDR